MVWLATNSPLQSRSLRTGVDENLMRLSGAMVVDGFRLRGVCPGRSHEIMKDKRGVQRASCVSKCLLYYKGSKYLGILEDISLTGALVTMTSSLPYVIKLGDSCSLLFCGDQEFCPNEHKSKVVRISSPKVGIQFVE